jgi:hypothetical protein
MASTPKTPHYRPPPSGPEGRGYVSPLGGQCVPLRYNLQSKQEARNRAQSAIPPELKPRNGQQGPRGPRGTGR